MSFYNHTQAWFNGEQFEGVLIFIFGMVLVLLSYILYQFGSTLNTKALTIPILVVGLLYTIGTGIGLLQYPRRMAESQARFQDDPNAFVRAEKARVEGFHVLYKYSVVFAILSFAFASITFSFFENRILQSVSIALLIVGGSLLIIDYFSKERAQTYYREILKYK